MKHLIAFGAWHQSAVTEFSVFQDANVKLIRELREEIRRLKAVLLSFELVCRQSELVCIQELLFFPRNLSPASLCAQLSNSCGAEAGAETGWDYSDSLCSFRWSGHPRTLSSLLSKGICLNGSYSVCGQIWGMGPSRKISLNSPSFCQSEPKYLGFWFISDFNYSLSLICIWCPLTRVRVGWWNTTLSLCRETSVHWVRRMGIWRSWFSRTNWRWVCEVDPIVLYLTLGGGLISIIPGPRLFPRQHSEVLSGVEIIFVFTGPRMGDLRVWRAGDKLSDLVFFS